MVVNSFSHTSKKGNFAVSPLGGHEIHDRLHTCSPLLSPIYIYIIKVQIHIFEW